MKNSSISRLPEALVIVSDRHVYAGISDALRQVLSSRQIILYPVFLCIVATLFILGEQSGIPFSVFTRDPLSVVNGKPYFGLLSNVGILFWSSTSAICLFTATLLNKPFFCHRRRFYIMSGLLTVVLLLDDLFLLHEEIFPAMLGIRQRYVLLAYLLMMVIYLVTFYKLILEDFTAFMLAALMLFGLSMAEDLVTATSQSWHYLVEDGAKLFGIISWFNFFVCLAQKEIKSCIDNRSI